MEKCPECSGKVTSRMKKCPECGAVFKKCPRCKEMVTESDKKCSGCGAALGLLGDLSGNKTDQEQKEFEDKTKEWIKNNPVAFGAILLGFLVIGLIAALTQDSKRKNDWGFSSPPKKEETKESSFLSKRDDSEKIYSIGELVSVKEFSYQVVKAEDRDVIDTKRADGHFKIIYFKIENKGKDSRYLYYNNFNLVDSQGRKFSASSEGLSAYMMEKGNKGDKAFFGKTLNPGVETEMVIVFDIPQKAVGLKLQVSGGFWGWKKKFIRID